MTLIPDLERDLVEAAERRRSPRRRARQVVAVGVGVAAALAVAVVTFSSSDERSGPGRVGGHGEPEAIPAPPQGTPPAAPGTLVRLSTFEFRGVRYEMSGYLSRAHGPVRNDSVCVQIRRTPPVAPGLDRASVTCAGDGLLRRGLRRERVLNVGFGGGPPQRLEVTGFTVAGVSGVSAVGKDWPYHAELTRSWRPWDGRRIRAFVVIADPPRGAKSPRGGPYTPIRAVEAGR